MTWGRTTLEVVTAIGAVGSLVFLAVQTTAALEATRAATAQAEAATTALEAQTRTADWEFLAGVAVAVDDGGIVITNKNEMSLQSAAYWYLQTEDAHLQEVEGAIGGVSSCSTTTVPWMHFEGLETEHLPGDAPVEFDRGDPDAQELHVALQAPSGGWYLKGSGGSVYSIELAPATSGELETALPQDKRPSDVPQDIASYPYELADTSLKALRHAEVHVSAADTYWGGADSVNTFVADTIVQPGEAVTFGFATPQVLVSPLTCG